MCGVAGIFDISGQPIDNAEERIRLMVKLLEHRGPDSEGIYISKDKALALGHTRLAIVDPTCTLKHPLETQDQQVVLSFNGEIYDYMEKREELIKKGSSFRSKMDTEILLEGLRLEGEDFLNRIDGIWAFAYYNTNKKKLLLSRDLLGERHLFYFIKGSEIIFASEVQPILYAANHSFDFDFDAVVSTLRYYCAPPGKTLIKGIQKLLPGHNLVAEIGGQIKTYQYRILHPEKWFDFFEDDPSLDQVIEVYGDIFLKSCRRRIPRDMSFFCTLSGGIDSAIVCAYASNFGKDKIDTLFGQSSELAAHLVDLEGSKFTSEKLNTRHHHTWVNGEDSLPFHNKFAENGFDGMIDPGTMSFEMLGHYIRGKKEKVVLIADGPDELNGGYPNDIKMWKIDKMRRENPLKYSFIKLLSSSLISRAVLNRLGLDKGMFPFFQSHQPFRFHPVHEGLSKLYLFKLFPKLLVHNTTHHFGGIREEYNHLLPKMDFSQKQALSYATLTLPDMYNLRTDKGFMHASVECRLPHQATDMVEFLLAVPEYYRFKGGGETKYLLRNIVKKHVGSRISSLPKSGFSTDVGGNKSLYRLLKIDETLKESEIYKEFPFKNCVTSDLILRPEYRKMRWHFFVLAKTYSKLREINSYKKTCDEISSN